MKIWFCWECNCYYSEEESVKCTKGFSTEVRYVCPECGEVLERKSYRSPIRDTIRSNPRLLDLTRCPNTGETLKWQ